jgi:hypothetical protein
MTPTAQALNIIAQVATMLNDYLYALLVTNGGRIKIQKEVLLQESQISDREVYRPFYIEEIICDEGAIKVFQQENSQFVDFGTFDLREKQAIIEAAAAKADKEAEIEYFPITSVAREDLKNAGFNAAGVSNETMERLVSKMSDCYVENSFWNDLDIIAESLGIPADEKKSQNSMNDETEE